MTVRRRLPALAWLALVWLAVAAVFAQPAAGQERTNHIAARLLAEGPVRAGKPLTLALAFTPEPGWHGYWLNPGDAGYPMQLDWRLPPGWSAGPPQYPVPHTLVLGGLMNHVYEGPYAVLVDLQIPAGAKLAEPVEIGLKAQWLACTDKICVPEQADLTLPVGSGGAITPPPGQFDRWRAAIPAELDRAASFELAKGALRVAIPLPEGLALPDVHLFVDQTGLV
ncbi:MAG: protein-disulfide reductase DsbD domain-containing protein, partial [Tsuneonella sp.]